MVESGTARLGRFEGAPRTRVVLGFALRGRTGPHLVPLAPRPVWRVRGRADRGRSHGPGGPSGEPQQGAAAAAPSCRGHLASVGECQGVSPTVLPASGKHGGAPGGVSSREHAKFPNFEFAGESSQFASQIAVVGGGFGV